MTTTKIDTMEMIASLVEMAKHVRELYKYSQDEMMRPTAFIIGDTVQIMSMEWSDDREKYAMAAAANAEARRLKARSLSFATDSRWVNLATFCEYYRMDAPNHSNHERLHKDYHRILKAHGGQIKNLPREVWKEAVTIFSNGPGIPITVQMAPYEEGPNDTIKWLPVQRQDEHSRSESALLTDWWS